MMRTKEFANMGKKLSPALFNLAFFKPKPKPIIDPGQGTSAWEKLKNNQAILSDARHSIIEGLDPQVIESKEFSKYTKAWWGEGHVANLQKKYFSPLEQAQLALDEVAEFLKKNRENLKKSDLSDPDIDKQMRANSHLQIQYHELVKKCREEKVKRCNEIIKQVIEQFEKPRENFEFITEALLIFKLKISGISLSVKETDNILDAINLVNRRAYDFSYNNKILDQLKEYRQVLRRDNYVNKVVSSFANPSLSSFNDVYVYMQVLKVQALTAEQCDVMEEAFYKASNQIRNEQSKKDIPLKNLINEIEKLLMGFRKDLREAEEKTEDQMEPCRRSFA